MLACTKNARDEVYSISYAFLNSLKGPRSGDSTDYNISSMRDNVVEQKLMKGLRLVQGHLK